jgi:aryl-alcohol dehydrogenase-like predicted oxidoreductase
MNKRNAMQQRSLGASGLSVSAIGLGCMGMSQGYGQTDDRQSADTLKRAVELGMTFWDTAQSYGAGHNETLLGTGLAGVRERIQLATKVGIVRAPEGVHIDAHPRRIRSYCDASLRRLGTDYIDLYYLHRVDPQIPIEESIGAMAELVDAGKVRHLGVSEVTAQELGRAAATHPIAAVQLEWSLWWREPEDDVIPAARRLGVAIVPYCPLGRGFLTGNAPPATVAPDDMRSQDGRFSGEAREHNLKVALEVSRIAATLGITTAQLALAWLLAQGDDVVPLPGSRKVRHLEDNAAAADLTLSDEVLGSLQRVAGRAMWAGDRRSFAARHTQRAGAA